ncbi:hypothetical protein N7474_006927 [Penicillium riverlandense]|uniref:uncharacterized protein n=1 Tax=Penicillium riverlandense TaxID=1903569 RepID=UPI002546A0B5|nr:uncharacterized protein N7474_006927 [Penicillium riverlandense]KAJ5815150.1 hypothetical protein N7474_006927 [Penicillium riverlandense]
MSSGEGSVSVSAEGDGEDEDGEGVGFLLEARRKGDAERAGEVDEKARESWGIVAGRIWSGYRRYEVVVGVTSGCRTGTCAALKEDFEAAVTEAAGPERSRADGATAVKALSIDVVEDETLDRSK